MRFTDKIESWWNKAIRAIIITCPFFITSCKKFVSIPDPISTITTNEVFSTDDQANSAMVGIYTQMINSNTNLFSNGATTFYLGLSSDELIDFEGTSDPNGYQFNSNTLLSTNNYINNSFWKPIYSNIYGANSILAGLAGSTSGLLHDSAKNELTGEAKFIRAYCFFYLTSLFGDVPLLLTTNFNQTALMTRTPQIEVFKQIVQDLEDAQGLLASDYSVGLGERIRPNKWAATALLARVYLYMKNWPGAEKQSTAIITNSGLYNLDNLSAVFNTNSNEAIWQLQQNNNYRETYNATIEGFNFIPNTPNSTSQFYLTNQLLASFEGGDLRYSTWVGVDSTSIPGSKMYYPYKYTLSYSQRASGGAIPQYYMMLRLAEQFLIRAEARANQGNITGPNSSSSDINMIRQRANLPLTQATTKNAVLAAIAHERQIELFAEWGHRWLDLKRTEKAIGTLSGIPMKTGLSVNALLYPIPLSEVQTDPNLTQNAGY